MKKRSIIIGVIILIIICVTVMVVSSKLAERREEIPEIVETNFLAASVSIRDKVTKIENSTKSVSVEIPQFQNLEDSYERYLNKKIESDLSDVNVYENAIEGYGSGEIGLFTYEVKYERYNWENYLSIVAEQYIHLGDGRPRIQKKCYVVDVSNNSSPALVDLFVNKNDYKAAILDEINRQAEEMQIELVGGNGLKDLSDTQAFYIKDGTLILYFESSEIAATAVGELAFTMPFEMVNGKFQLK